jgi:hypothetical protein
MVVALVVAAVILFLAIDAYVVYRWIKPPRHAGDYGAVQVPGEATGPELENAIKPQVLVGV